LAVAVSSAAVMKPSSLLSSVMTTTGAPETVLRRMALSVASGVGLVLPAMSLMLAVTVKVLLLVTLA